MGSCFSKQKIPLLSMPGPVRIQPQQPDIRLYYPFPNLNGNQTAIVVAPAYYSSINRTLPNPYFHGLNS